MKTTFRRSKIYAGILAAGTLLVGGLVQANDLAIEEVVVTAQKRSQSLQDVGIAVTAFSSEQIRDLGLSQAKDLAAQTPGVDIKNALGNNNPVITIRGVGLNDYHSNNNPSAAVHIDEVYLGSSAYLSFQMFDIERVEVLKGPQGTLYGRNATAGTVNFIANKPSQEFEASVDASYGNYNTSKLEAAIGGGLTDTISARLAFMKNDSDGYQTNGGNADYAGFQGDYYETTPLLPALQVTPADDKVNRSDTAAWRGALLFQPSEELDVLLSVHGSREKSGGLIYGLEGFDYDGYDPGATGFEDLDGDIRTGYDNVSPSTDSKGLGGQVRIDYDFAAATLTSISAYESMDRDIVDGDGHPLRMLQWDWSDKLWQKTQELRLTSSDDGNFHWITGLFYSTDEIDFSKNLESPDWIWSTWNTSYVQTADSSAAFVHTEWQFTDDLKLTTGFRYTEDAKRYEGGTTDLDPWGYGSAGVLLEGIVDIDEDDKSGKIGLDWTPNDDWLIYGSISKGFKSGGIDGSTARKAGDLDPFKAETLWSYELGFKSTLLDGSMQLNGSVFLYDYEDMQAEALQYIGGLPNSVRVNAGNVEMTGAELDLTWRPAAGLNIKAGVSVLDSEITQWNAENPENFEGNQVPDAPELTVNGLVRYEWPLDNGFTMAALTDFNYNGSTYKEVENFEHLKVSSYMLWNARVKLTSADEDWSVSLWGKNLGDKEYATNAFGNLSGDTDFKSRYVMYGAPRTFGLSVNYNWH